MKVLFLDFDGVLNSFQSDTRSYRTIQQTRLFRIKRWLYNHLFNTLLDWLPDRVAQSERVYDLRLWIRAFMLGRGQFCPIACSNLAYLLERDPEVRIVVSSVWRLSGLKYVKLILSKNGIDRNKVIDITPRYGQMPNGDPVKDDQVRVKGHQIQAWLNAHKDVKQFCIVDDDSDMAHLLPYLVKTRPEEGLMWRNLVDIAERLEVSLR